MASLGTLGDISAIGGAAGDLFGGIFGAMGDMAEAKAYKTAAKFSLQNAQISQEAGDIKQEQTSRNVFKTIGAQKAQYAGAGFTSGGSAQDVLRSSVSQGSLEKAIVNEQTQINVTGYESQAAQFQGMASAAKAAAGGGLLSGILKAGIALAPLAFSDRRMKKDVERIGWHGAMGLYRYRYVGEDKMRVGVIADEVAIHAPHALGPVIEGYATVDYSKLGLAHLAGA